MHTNVIQHDKKVKKEILLRRNHTETTKWKNVPKQNENQKTLVSGPDNTQNLKQETCRHRRLKTILEKKED